MVMTPPELAAGRGKGREIFCPAGGWHTDTVRRKTKGYEMPKIKTHRGAAKRFKVTGTGKIKMTKSFRRHILTSKTAKRKRQLRRPEYVDAANASSLKKLLPYL